MKFFRSLLSVWGLLMFTAGLVLNVWIYYVEAWPTVVYFIWMAEGIIFMLADIPLRRSTRFSATLKYLIQFAVVISSIAVWFLIAYFS